MPDRYGEPDDPEPDDNPQTPPDYAAAAKRGIARIRAQMGWNQPHTKPK